MRFFANGPSLPDELLLARDQSRVVFFCGAGVSRAKANLPDFFGLAGAVTRTLGVPPDDPAMKIIAEAREIGERTGVEGLISADRIFGLLERDFLSRDIYEAVAKALVPADSPDLAAHQTLLKLATTREGLVRVVTTNFDRLFDACRPDLPTFAPPNLPDPSHAKRLNGVVYLHGKINQGGNGAEGDGLILSSSEFGKAYLSEGWATAFVRGILERYVVVFVGYSADDPPVQYLLEALNRASGKLEGLYAFQSGDSNYANSKWQHKGVTAIAYDSADGHAALWKTLEAWAVRAEDPDAWVAGVVEMAKAGPEVLQPHERGQVAHVVSTVEGVKKFSEGDAPPPATWLCVFDPHRRYATPGKQGRFGEEGVFVDPFDFYSLDSDAVPDKVAPQDYSAKRVVPDGAWDAFALSRLDRLDRRDQHNCTMRGHWSRQLPNLLPRQFQLSVWIGKVAVQPEAVWWAVRHGPVHPEIQKQITWQLERDGNNVQVAVRVAWRYLFEFWSEEHGLTRHDWYSLASEIKEEGWSEVILRRFARLGRPVLKVEGSFLGGPIPEKREDYTLSHLVGRDVSYPDLPTHIVIPDDLLSRVVVILRKNLEIAQEVESEIGGYGLGNICPIAPDEDGDGVAYSRGQGLSSWVLYFVECFQRLMDFDLAVAKAEFLMWPPSDAEIFTRLRIWALGQEVLVPSEECTIFLDELSGDIFWANHHARDLLLALVARWDGLCAESRRRIEQRVLNGPERWENEEDGHFRERKAREVANRLNWIHAQGCELSLDLEKINEELRMDAPEWRPEYAKHAARSFEGRCGSVRTDTEYTELLNEPLATTLDRAKELSGRHSGEFVDCDPFAGLSQSHPGRAFAVLKFSAQKGEFPEWAWRRFLDPENRKGDQVGFTLIIGGQLLRYSNQSLAGIVRPVADWIQKFVKVLAVEGPELFLSLISRTIEALSLQPVEGDSAVARGGKDVDWPMQAINAPAGKLAEALFDDPQIDGLSAQAGFPKEWLERAESLLMLPGDLRRHALVICAHQLSRFFFVDAAWTQKHLLSVLNSDDNEDREALWAGLLWGGRVQGHELFVILKPHMLRMAKVENLERYGHVEVLTGLLLSAWSWTDENTRERWVANEELRDVLLHSSDKMRSRILWHAERWAEEKPEKWYPLLLELLRDVWPRQIAAKSGVISEELCDVAFLSEDQFPELAEAVLPLLVKGTSDYLSLSNFYQCHESITKRHPGTVLALLHAVLSDNVRAWPYEMGEVLAYMGEADASLRSDERFIEIKRKWDAR